MEVVTEAVAEEGLKWKRLSDDVAPIKKAVDGLDLDVTAFFIGLGPDAGAFDAAIHSREYDRFQSFMSTLLGGAVTEFEELGDALQKLAAVYDRTDSIAAVDLNKIFGETEY